MFIIVIIITIMMQAATALGLPGPRQSVGVEVEGNAYSVLLPYSVSAPCSATQLFTTLHDGQTQVTRLALLSASHIFICLCLLSGSPCLSASALVSMSFELLPVVQLV